MALKELYMKSGDGFVLVFSLTQLSSVNELGPLREQIVRIKNARVSYSTTATRSQADL
jgi:Ras-related protein Rap-1B